MYVCMYVCVRARVCVYVCVRVVSRELHVPVAFIPSGYVYYMSSIRLQNAMVNTERHFLLFYISEFSPLLQKIKITYENKF
jgi:hypothetical protein